jgi:hypothetical protein
VVALPPDWLRAFQAEGAEGKADAEGISIQTNLEEGETMKDFLERLHEGLVWWWDTLLGIGSLLVLAGFFIGTALRDAIKELIRPRKKK